MGVYNGVLVPGFMSMDVRTSLGGCHYQKDTMLLHTELPWHLSKFKEPCMELGQKVSRSYECLHERNNTKR